MFSFRNMLGEFEAAAKLGLMVGGIIAAPIGLVALAWFYANKDQEIKPDDIPDHVKEDAEKIGVALSDESGKPRTAGEMAEAVKEGVIAKMVQDAPEVDAEKRSEEIKKLVDDITRSAGGDLAAIKPKLPPIEQWRLDAFRVCVVGDATATRKADFALAEFSQQWFKNPQEALAAYDDGFPTERWQDFIAEVEKGLRDDEIFSFDEEAVIKATSVPAVYDDLEKRVMKATAADKMTI